MTLSDLDLIDANEAFAAQYLAVQRDLAMDPARVNVNGGAIALGYPVGGQFGYRKLLYVKVVFCTTRLR